MPFTRDTARQAGQKSGIARRDKPKEALSLERVQQELGRLETIEDAQRRLDLIGVWSLAGMLPGAVAGAAVRSVEVWIRAHESKLTREVVEDLKGEVDRLKRELKGRTLRVAP